MAAKKQNILIGIFCILLLITNITLWTKSYNHLKLENDILLLNGLKDSLIKANDSLLLVSKELHFSIDSLKNLESRVDSVIVEITNTYEKDFTDITNQPIASDAMYFSKYLSEDSTRFLNSNNSSTTKAY